MRPHYPAPNFEPRAFWRFVSIFVFVQALGLSVAYASLPDLSRGPDLGTFVFITHALALLLGCYNSGHSRNE